MVQIHSGYSAISHGRPDAYPFYGGCVVVAQYLQGISGGLSGSRRLSDAEHLSFAAHTQQLVYAITNGKVMRGCYSDCHCHYRAGCAAPQKLANRQ